MPLVIHRHRFADKQRVDAHLGHQLMAVIGGHVVYYDANEMTVACVPLPESPTAPADADGPPEFVDFDAEPRALLTNVPEALTVAVVGPYLLVQRPDALCFYEGAPGELRLAHSVTPAALGPVHVAAAGAAIFLLYAHEGVIQSLASGADWALQTLRLTQFGAVGLAVGPEHVYAVTDYTVIQLNAGDLARSKQSKIPLRSPVTAIAGVSETGELALLTAARQLVTISLATLKVTWTAQHVSKSPALFARVHKGAVILTTDANEVLSVPLGAAAHARPERTITQVKCDFYATLFRVDGLPLGLAPGVCMSEGALYFWAA